VRCQQSIRKKSVFVGMFKEVTSLSLFAFLCRYAFTPKTLLKNQKNVVFIVGLVVNLIKSLCQIQPPIFLTDS